MFSVHDAIVELTSSRLFHSSTSPSGSFAQSPTVYIGERLRPLSVRASSRPRSTEIEPADSSSCRMGSAATRGKLSR